MTRTKKSLATMLVLVFLTGCSYKAALSKAVPSSAKNNETSNMQDQADEASLARKNARTLNSSSNKVNDKTQTSSSSSSTTPAATQSSSSLPKTSNTPKKIITQAPKNITPPTKPQVTNTVQKVQLPSPPSANTNNSTKAAASMQNQSQNTSVNTAIQNIPGLPQINYEVNNYSEFYNSIYSSLKNFESSTYIKINNYSDNVYNLNVIDSILTDSYDVDYGLKSVRAMLYSVGDINVLNVQFSYSFTKDKLLSMRDASQAKALQIISQIIKPGMSDLDKEKAIHDYVVTHTAYDYENYVNGSLPGEAFNDYGVLVNGKAVCEGYSKAMLKLMRIAGLQAKSVVGYGLDGANKIPHAWNMVKINGNWTLVDATWDDPVPDEKNHVYYNYFDISDSEMAKDHQWDTNKYPKASAVVLNQ